MRTFVYRLGEYKIIESDTGELRWESHFGLGARQEGRCFRKGSILFVGPAENERLGFFKGEFLDHLKPLPAWLKTKYYCRGFEVYHCETGKSVTKKEMLTWMLYEGGGERERILTERPERLSNGISSGRAGRDAAFRLQQYEIIQKSNGQTVWRAAAGQNTVSGGNCILLEDILFIGSRQNERTGSGRRRFFENLQQLPKWDRTPYYCPRLTLHSCKTRSSVREESKRRTVEKRVRKTRDPVPGQKHSIKFEWKNFGPPLKSAALFARRAVESGIAAAAGTLSALSSFFGHLIRVWKALKRRFPSGKGKPRSDRFL